MDGSFSPTWAVRTARSSTASGSLGRPNCGPTTASTSGRSRSSSTGRAGQPVAVEQYRVDGTGAQACGPGPGERSAPHVARRHQPRDPTPGVRLPARPERFGQVDPPRDPQRPEPTRRRDRDGERRRPLRPFRGPQGRHRRRASEGHLHDSSSVGAALRYTAELRLPPGLSRSEVESSVSDILGVAGLTKRRDTLIRHLSGGQVKRASLANELVARPSLLFLDEVTSGLDEQTDREVMVFFREVAEAARRSSASRTASPTSRPLAPWS